MKFSLLYASWRDGGEEHSWPMAVHNELLKRGHEVRDYNLYHANGKLHPRHNIRHYSDEGLNKMYADIRAGRFVPEVIFQLDYGQYHSNIFHKEIFPQAIWVGEMGDDPQSFRSNSYKAARFDFVLTPHLPCLDLYHRIDGVKAFWWTQSCDIDYLNMVTDVEIQFEAVSTCGPRGEGLTEQIKEALGDQFAYDRFYYNEEHTKRLKSGNIVFHCSQYKEIGRRIMEGMGCGKMVITDRLPQGVGLNDMFVEDEEIVFYSDAKEAIEKIKYYNQNPIERDRIATNGYNKVMQFHTVAKRVDFLLEKIQEVQRDKQCAC